MAFCKNLVARIRAGELVPCKACGSTRRSKTNGRCLDCDLKRSANKLAVRLNKWFIFLSSRFKWSCQICGYNKCYSALEFHHKEGSKKDYSVSAFLSHKDTTFEHVKALFKEVSKCNLLCTNCHREVHAGLISVDDLAAITLPLNLDNQQL